MKARKKTATKTVTTDSGCKLPLPNLVATGEAPCPGDAHSNPYIDNCMICAPRWGVVTTYAMVDVVEATKAGFAVPLSYTEREAAEKAEAEGLVKQVHVTEKTRAYTSSFYAYVAA